MYLCVLVDLVCEERLAPSDGYDPVLEPFGGLAGGESRPPAAVALPPGSHHVFF